MKKFFIRLSVICLAVCAGLICAPYLLDTNFIARHIAEKSTEATGSPLILKHNPKISFFPPVLTFSEASWQSQAGNIRAAAQGGKIILNAGALLAGSLRIDEIFIEKPQIELNQDILASMRPGKQASHAEHAGLPIEFDRIVAQHGSLSINAGNALIKFSEINLSLENFHPRHESDLKCDFVLDFKQTDARQENMPAWQDLSGNMAIQTKMRYYAPNITFRQTGATFTATSGQLVRLLSPCQLQVEGAANLRDMDYKINSAGMTLPQGHIKLKGEGNFSVAKFSGNCELEVNMDKIARMAGLRMTKKQDSHIIAISGLNFENNLLDFENIALKAAESQGSGAIKMMLPDSGQPASLSGELRFGWINPGDFQNLRPVSQTEGHDALQIDGFEAYYPSINLKVGISRLGGRKFGLTNAGFRLVGAGGIYNLEKFACGLAGGSIAGGLQANLPERKIALDIQGERILFGEVLSALDIGGFRDGMSSFSANLYANGFSLQDIRSSLSGHGRLETRGARMEIMRGIADTAKLLGLDSDSLPVSLDTLSASFRAEKGLVDFMPVAASGKNLNASGKALANLRNSTLDAALTIRALGLELPLTFKGPFNNIEIGLARGRPPRGIYN